MGAIGESLKPIDKKWENGTDYALIQVLGSHPISDSLLTIRKTYLSSRRIKRFPKKTQLEQYDIVDAQSGKVVPLLSANVDEKINIGTAIWNGTAFVIPLIKSYKDIELHFFDPELVVIKNIIKMPDKHEYISGIHATTNGYITTYAEGAYVYADFNSYKPGTASFTLPIVPKGGNAYPILDITERDNRVYMALRGENTDYDSAVWLYSFDTTNPLETSHYEKLSEFYATITNVSFIPSMEDVPSMWIKEQRDYNDMPSITIVRAGDTQTPLWEKRMTQWFEWTYHSLFDFGGNTFLLSKITQLANKKRAVTFNLIGKQNKNGQLKIENELLDIGIFTAVDFYPTPNGLYAIIAYSSNGSGKGVYWHGYKIKKLALQAKKE